MLKHATASTVISAILLPAHCEVSEEKLQL